MTTSEETVYKGLIGGIQNNVTTTRTIGIILIAMGAFSLVAPVVAGASLTFMVGLALLLAGLGQSFLAIKVGMSGRGLMVGIVGLLTFLVGVYMVRQPVSALTTITVFLALYFMASGIVECVEAFKLRPIPGWGWILANGLITLLLGLMIWKQLPFSGIWAVGVLFGIKLVFSGFTMVTLAGLVKEELEVVAEGDD